MGYQHLAFTWDSLTGNVAGFKNGLLLNTFAFPGVSGNWSDPAEEWLLGARKNGGSSTDYFGGLIDEVSAWNTVLSSDAATEIYNSGVPNDLTSLSNASSSDLKAWYKM